MIPLHSWRRPVRRVSTKAAPEAATQREESAQPDISHPTWGGYGKLRAQYGALERAYRLNAGSALHSALWGHSAGVSIQRGEGRETTSSCRGQPKGSLGPLKAHLACDTESALNLGGCR